MNTEQHPYFTLKSATAGAKFRLSTGAALTVLRSPDSVLIAGEYGEVKAHIALSNEASEILLSALILSRPDKTKPLIRAELDKWPTEPQQQERQPTLAP